MHPREPGGFGKRQRRCRQRREGKAGKCPVPEDSAAGKSSDRHEIPHRRSAGKSAGCVHGGWTEGRDMDSLNRAMTNKKARPVRVVQFGEGNFLRAFVDYMIDIANEQGKFDGDIVLMHDLYSQTAAASRVIIPELLRRGYQLVTVSELSDCRGAMAGGGVYTAFR